MSQGLKHLIKHNHMLPWKNIVMHLIKVTIKQI